MDLSRRKMHITSANPGSLYLDKDFTAGRFGTRYVVKFNRIRLRHHRSFHITTPFKALTFEITGKLINEHLFIDDDQLQMLFGDFLGFCLLFCSNRFC